jgi:hypothetical protein
MIYIATKVEGGNTIHTIQEMIFEAKWSQRDEFSPVVVPNPLHSVIYKIL